MAARSRGAGDGGGAAQARLRARLWVYQGNAAWTFLSLPKAHAKRIRQLYGGLARGWGSLPVLVGIGETAWRTSIFPDSKSGTYLLPVKAAVRKAEGLAAGQEVEFTLKVLA